MSLNAVKKIPFVKRLLWKLDNLNERREFVATQLSLIKPGSLLLDAGCGSKQFREFCAHLDYRSQDFAQYTGDDKKMMGADRTESITDYVVRPDDLDYVGDIWDIDAGDDTFDAILCTEVFEHIPYPIETVKEFSRLLKTGGRLILTAPGNCLRHMDPYFFYSGFSDRWFEKVLGDEGFNLISVEPVGDYYSWIGVEIWRTARNHSILAKLLLLPTFLYYFSKRKTDVSVDTLCMGYHVVAEKS